MTDPAAAAAKLLPCLKAFVEWAIRTGPWDGHDLDGGSIQEKAVELGILMQTKYDPSLHGEDADADVGDPWFVWSDLWNTRPQPAPPEVEPDFTGAILELLIHYGIADADCVQPLCRDIDSLIGRAYRLGFAARPEVEDAEVACVARDLREAAEVLDSGATKILGAGFFIKAADLLERLASELVEVKRDRDSWHRFYQGYRKDFEALYRRLGVPDTNDEQAGINLCDRITALLDSESKLAEREAELAAAEDVINAQLGPGEWQDHFHAVRDRAVAHCAARQQQKASADKDKP